MFQKVRYCQDIVQNGIRCDCKLIISKDYFEKSINDLLNNSQYLEYSFPIIHISTHGTKYGIGSTLFEKSENNYNKEELISWSDLSKILLPINQRFNNKLIVCLSCCHGAESIPYLMSNTSCYSIITKQQNSNNKWQTYINIYKCFYNLLSMGCNDLDSIIHVMNYLFRKYGFIYYDQNLWNSKKH